MSKRFYCFLPLVLGVKFLASRECKAQKNGGYKNVKGFDAMRPL